MVFDKDQLESFSVIDSKFSVPSPSSIEDATEISTTAYSNDVFDLFITVYHFGEKFAMVTVGGQEGKCQGIDPEVIYTTRNNSSKAISLIKRLFDEACSEEDSCRFGRII